MNIEGLRKFVTKELKKKLSDKLTYHGLSHTEKVYQMCENYSQLMRIPYEEVLLVKTAALMHDTGFLFTYDNHEEASIRYAQELLPEWNYSRLEIETISSIILATKIPQTPKNTIQQIIGDADLDYLGTESFYTIGQTLYNELLAYDKIANEEEWDRLQVDFLKNHKYHTPFAQQYREPVKQKFLKEILEKWGWE